MQVLFPSKIVNPFQLPKIRFGTGQSSGQNGPPTLAPVLIFDPETGLGESFVNLRWTASNKVTSPGFGYRIYMDVNGNGFTELFTVSGGTLSVSGYTPSPPPAGESYTFRITPYNDFGEGLSSNDAIIVLPGEGEAPILSGPSSVFATPFTLSWTAVPGATTYDLERSTDNITFSLLVNTALFEYETNESSQGYYYFRVKPLAGAFEGTTSNTVTVEYIVPLPWILESGVWDDAGEWRDISNWND